MSEQTSLRSDSTNEVRPILVRERMDIIDVLRGFTILGILLVNMSLYGWPNWGPLRAIRTQLPSGSLDEATSWFLWLFAEDKFYPLLSFLFGVGFSIQLARSGSRAANFLSIYCRRLLVLLLIGLVHGLLLWSGDILVRYALIGFLLLPFRERSPKTILVFAIILVFMPIVLLPLQQDVNQRLFVHIVGANVDYKELWNESLHAYRRGTFAEISLQRVRATAWSLSWPISWLQILGLFLMGLYAGRREFFQNLQARLTVVRKAFWWALPLSVGGMLVRAGVIKLPGLLGPYLSGTGDEVLDMIGCLALSVVYATSIILLAQRVAWKPWLRPLAAVGRMALSNYLFQSLACTTLFYSYGFGMFGKVEPFPGLCLTIAIYICQALFSVEWLRYYRFGPMEWIWRSLTYGKLQPMRVASSVR
jgi:uncharacterized protein